MPPPSKRPQAHWLAIAGLFLATVFLHSELAALRALPQRRGLHGVERDDTAAMPPPLEGDLEQLVEERVDRKLSVVDERMEQLVEERVDRKLSAVDERIGTLEAQVERLSRAGKGDRRRTQRTGAVGGEAARIIIRNTAPAPSTPGGRGGRGRRAQSVGTCAAADISSRTQAITAACCDDPSAGCSGGGTPQTCNAECAGIFLPFWDECQSALGKARRVFEPVVVMCEAVENETPSLAMQLGVTCTDGTSTDDCVPTCNEDIHGFLLLLNINGNDNKLSCELQHGLYSWVGSSTDGGYLGPDIQTFFSAVTSGAAGVYVGTLVEDAGVSTTMVVTAGQSISISGDPSLEEAPQWALASDDTCYGANNGYCNDGSSGDGGGCPLGTDATDCGTPPNDSGFVVQAHGYLFLSYIALGGAPVMLNVGGSLSLTSMIVPEAALIQAMSAVHGVGSEGSALRLTDVSVLEARSDDTCRDWGGQWGRGRLSDNGFCEDGGRDSNYRALCRAAATWTTNGHCGDVRMADRNW
eukprot:COSAG06_NODE_9843_length_1805_cov_5.563306_1_plen_524_part_01